MSYNESIIVIPAYEPDQKLIDLLKNIKKSTNSSIIVINDGSSSNFDEIFVKASSFASILSHEVNKGKGEAIKTALRQINKTYPSNAIITIADADGQHTVNDIIAVSRVSSLHPESLIIGSRKFSGEVPFKSRFGNSFTRLVFKTISGKKIYDTQTGLRAFQASMIPFLLTIEGSRYEYETNMLLSCVRYEIDIIEVPIKTIYINDNQSSHFNPLLDSLRIYKKIFKYSISSFISFLLDFSIYGILLLLTGGLSSTVSLFISNSFARTISSIFNFHFNKTYVFRDNTSIIKTAVKYFSLVIGVLIVNSILLTLLVNYIHLNAMLSKIIVEVTLFFINYIIQNKIIFNNSKKEVANTNVYTNHLYH